MTSYTAPVQEMTFVLNELAGAKELTQLPGFEEVTADVVEAVLEEASKFSAGVLAPLNKVGDEQGVELVDGQVRLPEGFADAYRQFTENGWLSLSQNPEFEGQGLPLLIHMAATEMWNSANMAFTLCPMLTVGAVEAIETHASNELKQQYLPKMISGEWTGTMNLTEPQAGSDLAALASRAVPEGDHYLITGQKIYISWGDHEMTDNIVHLVLARLPDAPAGVKGISLFLVPKYLVNEDGSLGERNDLRAVSLEHKMGIHASPTCVMSYGDNGGAIGYLVGEANNGLAGMFTMMNQARLEVGLEGVALSESAYQHAVGYARERVQGVAPGHRERVAIIEHADVRRMLMIMRAHTEAMRALSYVTASVQDQLHKCSDNEMSDILQSRLDLLTPIVKAWSTEVAQEVTGLGLQVHGGMGFIEETGVAQFCRDVRITTIYEGTTGIQANDLVGRKLLRDGGAAFNKLLVEVEAVAILLSEAQDSGLKDMASSLRDAAEDAQRAAHKILDESGSNIDFVHAVAFNFLMLMGTLLGGWQMARAALIAEKKLASEEGDKAFNESKIITAAFYSQHILPRVKSYVAPVLLDSTNLYGLAPEQF